MSAKRIIPLLVIMAVLAATFTLPAFADGNDTSGWGSFESDDNFYKDTLNIIKTIKPIARQIWTLIKNVVGPIAAVSLCYSAFRLFVGGSKDAEEAKSGILKVIFALSIVLLAPSIISAVREYFKLAGLPW